MEKTALLVIDFINDIVHPEGKIAASANFIKEKQVIEKVNQAIAFARKQNIFIVFVKVGFSAGYIECPEYSPVFSKIKKLGALKLNTWDTEFYEKLAVKPDDAVVVKHRVSAFYATGLETILRANQVENLLIAGVSTNMTVSTTTREAHDRDYHVTILEDACAAATQRVHDNTIELLAYEAQIVKVDDFIKSFAA